MVLNVESNVALPAGFVDLVVALEAYVAMADLEGVPADTAVG